MRCRSRNKDLIQCELDRGHDDMHTAQDTDDRVMLVSRWPGPEQELLAVNLSADMVASDEDGGLLEFFSQAIEALRNDGILEIPYVDAESLKAEVLLILRNDHFRGLTDGLLAAVIVARVLTELGMEAIDEPELDDPETVEDHLPV